MNRVTKTLIAVSFVSALVVGCGDKKGTQKLTDDQKATFRRTVESMGRTQEASVQARNNPVYGAAEFGKNEDDASRKMSAQILLKRCRVDVSLRAPGRGILNRVDNRLEVLGNACPVQLNYVLQSNLNGSRRNMQATYKVTDEEFKKLNDVHGYELTGTWATNLDATGTKGTGEGSMSGTITTKDSGTVGVNVKGTLKIEDQITSETTMNFTFPAFTVEMKRKQTGNIERPIEEHYINGERISASEFNTYLEKGGLIFTTVLEN